MKGGSGWLAIVIVGLWSCTALAGAEDTGERGPTIDLSLGALGVFDGSAPVRFGLEYCWQPRGRWSLSPGLGFLAAEDDSRFVFASLHRNFTLGQSWVLTLSFGGGLFFDGHVVRLGDRLMFQSGVEIGRSIGRGRCVGLAMYHLSNGGLSEENPGTEALYALVTVPVRAPRSQSGSFDSPAATTD